MNELSIALKLLLSWGLGAAIGLEREAHGHPAGLRTHILVCLGACLVTLVGVELTPSGGDSFRIAAQVVSGIGFLGAGTILRDGSTVKGLTTAASLWVVAGIGLAVGAGFEIGALVATIIMALSLTVLPYFEDRLPTREHLFIRLSRDNRDVGAVMVGLSKVGMVTRAMSIENNDDSLVLIVRTEPISVTNRCNALSQAANLPGVDEAWFGTSQHRL